MDTGFLNRIGDDFLLDGGRSVLLRFLAVEDGFLMISRLGESVTSSEKAGDDLLPV